MEIDTENLPDDIAIAHQLIRDLTQEKKSLLEELSSLREQLAIQRAKEFGPSSEKLDSQIEALDILIEATEEQIFARNGIEEECDEDDGQDDKSEPNKKRPKRIGLPEHLPREDQILPAPTTCPSCGGEEFRKISDDISETLEYTVPSYKVIRHIRPRCACINCDGFVQAYAANKPIAKGKAGPGLLAHVIIQKYCDHLPLYRQNEIFARHGIIIPRSTLAGWVMQCASLLAPLVELIRSNVMASSHIHSDDTPVAVLSPGNGKTKTGRIWVYARDDRAYGSIEPIALCYFYSADRKGERPLEHLKNFKGVMHTDSYSGYNKACGEGRQAVTNQKNGVASDINRAGCWAHVRRKFYEVTLANKNAKISAEALLEIGKLYDVERSVRGMKPEIRLIERQKISKQIIEKLYSKWEKYKSELPKQSATAKAISYAQNSKDALLRFLDDGQIEIDNNVAERAMRPIALGRKNWLFAGSDIGGQAAASMYTLIETADLNDIDPEAYLRWVLTHIQDHNSQKLDELLPWNMPKN